MITVGIAVIFRHDNKTAFYGIFSTRCYFEGAGACFEVYDRSHHIYRFVCVLRIGCRGLGKYEGLHC